MLVMATKSFFDTFIEQMHGRVNTLDLYDRELTFIHTFGSAEASANQGRRYAISGYRCSEKTSGIRAMSMAQFTGKPAQLIGAEHYDVNLHNKICTSVPIFTSDHRLAGIINLAEQFMPDTLHTISTLAAISQGVEYNLSKWESRPWVLLSFLEVS